MKNVSESPVSHVLMSNQRVLRSTLPTISFYVDRDPFSCNFGVFNYESCANDVCILKVSHDNVCWLTKVRIASHKKVAFRFSGCRIGWIVVSTWILFAV